MAKGFVEKRQGLDDKVDAVNITLIDLEKEVDELRRKIAVDNEIYKIKLTWLNKLEDTKITLDKQREELNG